VRILQLFSDWKWTGPAEPMLQLVRSLRACGHESLLVCSETPEGIEGSVEARARAAGSAPLLTIRHARGAAWRRDTPEVRRLRVLLDERDIDIVHTWHTRDHVMALRAAAGRRRAGRTRIVRSVASAAPIAALPWNRWLFGPGTDGLLCTSPATARANARLRGGRPSLGAVGAVDVERFTPEKPDPAVRAALGLAPDARVVGIAARVQRHRRFELLLEAVKRLAPRDPAMRLLVLGRGTHIREVAEEPAARLGIADRVLLAGYRGEDYLDCLRAMDVFTFVVPGSDGGCRALLEAQACGLPAVTSGRGALPEIIVDGETGIVVDENADSLAEAWYGLLEDPERRARMGRAARRRAERLFRPERYAADVEGLYRAVLGPGSQPS
jgi:glycosyltransferase involved in cell wall biosynthesis